MTKIRVRIHFTKSGDLRWISHRDLARLWERLLRRADLKLAFSEGFHPKPKISFPSALALGIVALDEIVEMDLLGQVDLKQAQSRIEQQMPEGMQLLSLTELTTGMSKAQMIAATYEVTLDQSDAATAREAIDRLQAGGQIEIERDGKTMVARFDDPLLEVNCEGNVLRFTLPTTAAGSLRPSELLTALSIAHILPAGAVLTRTRVHLASSSVAAVVAPAIGQEAESVAETAAAELEE